MKIANLQGHVRATPDGIWGQKSRDAFMAQFTNRQAPAIDAQDIARAAARIGCSPLQVRAVQLVEASGRGFDALGRPKMLFERHKFHRFTGGRHSVTDFSNPQAGGYKQDSWAKLNAAIATGEVDAAFMACSWGAFQVLGEHWRHLGYPSPYAMAWTCAQSEGDHLELLCRFIAMNQLQDAMRALSADPETCRPFAKRYNGAGYERFDYHRRLAAAMKAG